MEMLIIIVASVAFIVIFAMIMLHSREIDKLANTSALYKYDFKRLEEWRNNLSLALLTELNIRYDGSSGETPENRCKDAIKNHKAQLVDIVAKICDLYRLTRENNETVWQRFNDLENTVKQHRIDIAFTEQAVAANSHVRSAAETGIETDHYDLMRDTIGLPNEATKKYVEECRIMHQKHMKDAEEGLAALIKIKELSKSFRASVPTTHFVDKDIAAQVNKLVQ